MLPGDCVSSDHFECRVKGRFPHNIDKEDPDLMYRGGILFVDHASNYISVHHQVSRGERGEGGADTVRSKELYEQEAAEYGVYVISYRGTVVSISARISKNTLTNGDTVGSGSTWTKRSS